MAKYIGVTLQMNNPSDDNMRDVVKALRQGPGVVRVVDEGGGKVKMYAKTSKMKSFSRWMDDMWAPAQPKM